MKKVKREKTEAEISDVEDYLRASLRAVEMLQRRPKYTNPDWDSEEQGIHDCLGWMRGSLMMALDLRNFEKKEPKKEGTTAEEDLRATVQAIDVMMRKPEYANSEKGTTEYGFCKCLKWMRAISEIAIELIEAEKDEKMKRRLEWKTGQEVKVNENP